MHIQNNLFRNILLFSLTVGALHSCKEEPKKTENVDRAYVLPDSLKKTLKFDTVKYESKIDALTLTGSVDFNQDNMVRIYPIVSGSLQNVKVMLGDYVNAGQVLGTIKSADMATMSNSIITSKTNLDLAKKNLDAAKDMFKSGLSSQQDLAQAQATYDAAKSSLSLAEQVSSINGHGNGITSVIKAPISGYVVEKNVTNNTVIRSDNSDPMFTISDLKNVWIMANVYESNLQKVRKGDNVDITTLSYPDRVFHGKIDEIMNVLDPQSKVMKVKIVLPNPDNALKPQMFASINVIQNENGQALAISSSSLIFDNSQYYVLVYKSPSDIRITPVQIQSRVGNRVYISSGVEQGDELISKDALLIYQALNG